MVFVSIFDGSIHMAPEGRQSAAFKPTPSGAIAFLRMLGHVSPGGLYSVSSSVDFPEDGGLPGFKIQTWLESGYALAEERESARVG